MKAVFRNVFLPLFLLLCVFVPGMAQSESAVKITNNLVRFDAVVTKNGKPVKDLKAQDFEIFEDGRRQEITSFAYASGPRTIALVVDDYGLSSQSMAEIKRKLRKFIDEQLRPSDQLAIVLTSTVAKLERNLEQLVWNKCSRVGAPANPSLNGSSLAECGPYVASANDSLRAVRLTVSEMSKLPGRKSLVLFSDNLPTLKDDPVNTDGLNKLTELAMRSSVVMYAVDPGGFHVTSLTPGDNFSSTPGPQRAQEYKVALYLRSAAIQRRREAARLMVEQTGGFLVKDQKTFQLDDILEDQNGYYLIGYRPSTRTFNKSFHKLKVRVKKPGMTVRTRSGFFGMTDK
jgi:VWFA-related protein